MTVRLQFWRLPAMGVAPLCRDPMIRADIRLSPLNFGGIRNVGPGIFGDGDLELGGIKFGKVRERGDVYQRGRQFWGHSRRGRHNAKKEVSRNSVQKSSTLIARVFRIQGLWRLSHKVLGCGGEKEGVSTVGGRRGAGQLLKDFG